MRFATALALLSFAAPALAQPFDVPWIGYDAGSSAYPGNPAPFERDPYAIASADLDGDGDVDVVLANYDYASPGGTSGQSGFVVLMNDGAGVLGAPVHYTFTAKGSFDVVAGDFDEDGDPDLALPNSGRISGEDGNTVVVFSNDGTGAFTLTGEYPVAERPMSLATGDFNGDGHLDLVADSYRFDSQHVAVLFGNGAGGFAPRVLVDVGDSTDDVSAADLNDDGRDDIVVTVLGDLYVVMSDGAGGFTLPQMVSEAGSQPVVGLTAVADLNADGLLDIAHGSYQAYPGTHHGKDLAVRFGTAPGTWGAPVYYNLGEWTPPEAIVPADMDGDGDLDLVMANWSGRTGDGIGVFFNDGAGAFGNLRLVPAGQGTADLVVVDIDGNGTPDVVTTDRMSMAATVHTNPGDGLLPIHATRFDTVPLNIRLDAGDVDGDGDLDFFTSTESTGGPGALLRNNGSGAFAAPVQYTHGGPQGAGVGRAKLRDLDGDGDLDVIYNNPHTDSYTGYHYYTMTNDGTGTFGAAVLWPLGTCGNGDVDAFDLDNDGDLDSVNLEELNCIAQDNGNRIFVGLNDGTGSFQQLPPFAISQAPHTLAGGDFNEDGVIDLATVHEAPYGFYRTLNIHIGIGDGTFQEEVVYNVGQGPTDILTADLDGDGHLDLATANMGRDDTGRETLTVLWGTGTGSFAGAVDYYVPYSPDLLGSTGVQAGDVDDDGDLDLMVTSVANLVSIYYNDGARVFQGPHRLGIYWRPQDTWFADVDGDGVSDFATLVSAPGGIDQLAIVHGVEGIATPTTPAPAPVVEEALTITAAPNPAAGRVTLTVTAGTAGAVAVDVFDVMGRRVAIAFDSELAAGVHAIAFDTGRLAPGMYVVRVTGSANAATTRLVVGR